MEYSKEGFKSKIIDNRHLLNKKTSRVENGGIFENASRQFPQLMNFYIN